MHITTPRVLGLLMFLALIGYAFVFGPWINATASTYSPASSVTTPKVPAKVASKPVPKVAPKVTPTSPPHAAPSSTPLRAPFRAE
jgi:hypothetical protein